jgi:hypothetical protein
VKRLTRSQQQVLKRIPTDGDLFEAFDWFRCSHRSLPFMVDDKAFTKVLDSLVKRGLLELKNGYYATTEAGKEAAIAPLKCRECNAVMDEFDVCPYGCKKP